jgi:hypothetical protein
MAREGSILLVLAVAAISCAQTPAPVLSEARPAAEAPPAFERRSVERTRGDCTAETAPCARFVAQFFVVSGGVRPAVREAVNRSLLGLVAGRTALGVPEDEGDEPPATIDEAAIDFFSGWAESRAELPEDAPAAYARWVDERRLEVIHADHRVLSVELGLYAFTGGAHPNTFIELASFDLATGKPLELADLVAAGADARLAALGAGDPRGRVPGGGGLLVRGRPLRALRQLRRHRRGPGLRVQPLRGRPLRLRTDADHPSLEGAPGPAPTRSARGARRGDRARHGDPDVGPKPAPAARSSAAAAPSGPLSPPGE